VIYPASNMSSAIESEPSGFNDFVGGSKFLVCVARWQPHKNVESLVRAFAQYVSENNDGLKLILVGKPVGGHMEPQNEIVRNAIEKDCWVTSDLSDGELKYLYSRAELNIFPSVHEGFGLSVLEGITCGCPALVHVGGATEEVAGVAGVATDTTNPLKFAEDIEFCLITRSSLAEKAILRAKDFSWEASVDSLLEIYK
jgi:glycosyltransferase involved in cell wall biosynthesis